VLGAFLPLLLATFSVCLFVFLMQFLWKYVDDMVGKGAEMKVLAEFFFYAAVYLVPMALPVAILFASLMTFGNLGEYLELLAMKSSGISLIRIMKPLIILVVFISGVAFVFQNNILPGTQAKLWTIAISLRMKSPELDIPERSFYKDIPGYNVFVRHKNKTGLLLDVMVYDHSKGFDNAEVLRSDSGRMKMSDDKKHLILTLYNGTSFQNIGASRSRLNQNQNQIPFQRQTFTLRDFLIEFDSNFNMADKSIMQNRDISKNIPELRSFIRTASAEDDSLAQTIRPVLITQVYTSAFKQKQSSPASRHLQTDTTADVTNFELLYKNLPLDRQIQVLADAKLRTERIMNDFSNWMNTQSMKQKEIRGHKIELHRKFTYSLACLLFFFIGAPLGAIIRKGGLGWPAILSVFLFIVYYTIDTFGWKMARQESWPVWEGMWLSSLFLASLGVFLTYKAVNDSVVMNPDTWKETLQQIFGKREIRNYARKEVIMNLPNYPEAIRLMEQWNEETNLYLEQKQKIPFYGSFRKQNFPDEQLNSLLNFMNQWIEDLLNSDENLIIGKLMDYPVISPHRFYIMNFLKQKQTNNDLRITMKVNDEICKELKNLKLDCSHNPEK